MGFEIVGKLTARVKRRREFVAGPTVLPVFIGIILLVSNPQSVAGQPQWHPIEEIRAAAETFLLERVGRDASTTVHAGALDPRHKLARCTQPLTASLRPGAKITQRTIVGVRCDGTRRWKLYVPVTVVVTADVLVARRTLPRGHLLREDDIMIDRREISGLAAGYLGDARAIVGQRLKSQVLAGNPLTPRVLEINKAIKRGQSVTIVVRAGGINIQMAGKALADGAMGQRIRVENTNSGRVVEGIVRSREHVEVLVPADNRFFHAKPKVSPRVADTRSSNNDR